MKCEDILKNHTKLKQRQETSKKLINQVRKRFSSNSTFNDENLTVFSAGSLAREEVGKNSDLDVFVVANDEISKITRLNKLRLLVEIMKINDGMEFPEFSNDGEYLRFYSIKEITDNTGSRKDDFSNLFTTRMLFLLESKYLYNKVSYELFIDCILENYFRDKKGKKTFKPLFLLNDILRYWRTLCLNYEEKRNDPTKPWRKKNINLKFSRKLTVFGTVLPLIARPMRTKRQVIKLTKMKPLERMAYGLDILSDESLINKFEEFIDYYEDFLGWKELDDPEKYFSTRKNKMQIEKITEEFSNFIYQALAHESINQEFRRYLVI